MTSFVTLVAASDVAFWIAAPVMVFCALSFLISRRPVHSAVYMAGVMIGLAVLFAAQDAPFLFVAQIIVYTGAILMMFLFVVMLIGVQTTDSIVETIRGHRVAAILAAVGLGVLLVLGVGRFAVFDEPAGLAQANEGGNVQSLAELVFHDYFLAFEISAALLITAAVGALLLTHSDELRRKLTQRESAQERRRAYVEDGVHPGAAPNSGVFARHNAISVPGLLPDGTVAEKSLSKTLLDRGVAVDVDQLRGPALDNLAAIETAHAQVEGEQE